MNMQNLMAQAQKMQKDIQKKQNEIFNTNYSANCQAVHVTINGKKEIIEFKINQDIIKDSEDIAALEDMVKIALNDVFSQVDKDTQNKLGIYAKGLNGLM